ncbi:Telomerase activating protein Est1 domain-containing protein [Phanerochaete sordida]|uniref:Telomerase activating protein Est1 domain-containing protein n=1 Tax=Phanerochaete sordida TaxID=48140 RepID=A0A9P3GSL1_9APHY|nr:Telomerase activating protein Est1 domain-containing protein [Phanerochaete sordida]
MSDAAAQIAREAKGLQQGLKDLLKTRDITDREIDIQRKNLRRQYLRLLFLHPYARESKDAETHLWMQTSYAIISIYKQRIANLDRAIHNPPRQGGRDQNGHSRVVEYRKLLQRFRQFLAEEEKFWMQLVFRLRRYFALDDAQDALNTLGITLEDDQTPAADGATYPRRNQHQFPPESDHGANDALAPASASQHESRMAILSKTLVCLGDIARYKEQYNEAGGRPRAGHEDGPPAAPPGRGRGRRGGAAGASHTPLPRLRNYDRAQSCYEQARLLFPHDGNPSHQLAILSSYQKDTLSSILHYYRALCVRTPYETASENLGTVLSKALDQYTARGLLRDAEVQEELANGETVSPRLRVEAFKEKVVVLHAQWSKNVEEARTMGERAIEDFAGLVADRILPIEMISKIIVLTEGALWKHRMVRRPSNAERRPSNLALTESNIVTHLLAAHRVLLENGSIELAEAPPEDAEEGDLAQRITATFRRTLPALRMAGKWLRSNTRYLSQGLKHTTNGDEEPSAVRDTPRKDRRNGGSAITIGGIHDFWREYVRFCEALVGAFPGEKLPELSTQLEEDIDMAGFLPLRKYMAGADGRALGPARRPPSENGGANGDAPGQQENPLLARDQVHPNEEQLMRIADILTDSKAVAEDEYTPIALKDGHFSLNASISAAIGKVSEPEAFAVQKEAIDAANRVPHRASVDLFSVPQARADADVDEEIAEDAQSVTTGTDGDPVGEAFRTALHASDEDEDEDEEQIVWQLGGTLSPRQDPVVTALPTTPPRPDPIGTNHMGFTPHRAAPLSPPFAHTDLQRSPPSHNTPLTTAQDLLQGVLGVHRSPPPAPSQHGRTPSAPSIPAVSYLGGNSIWSNNSSSLSFPSGNRPLALGNGSQYVTQKDMTQTAAPPPLPPSQTSWSSSYMWQSPLPSQNTQLGYSSTPSRTLLPQQPSIVNSGHHRLPSDTLLPSRGQALPPPSTHSNAHRYDPLNPSAAVGALPLTAAYGAPGANDRFAPAGHADVFGAPSHGAYFSTGGLQPEHLRYAGHAHAGEHAFAPQYDGAPAPAASRIWGNAG